ncbi:MAG: flagellar biosynthesis anti-sigma factor FlgM [Candidatus Sulfotelmatobacter sp.]
MKIDVNSPTPDAIVTPQGNTNNAPSTTSASTNQVQSNTEDKTTLAFDRANIASLVSQAMASPDVRQDKVEALRQAISNGQYKVEPDKVADAMLQVSPKE